jgi:hypothetical integral membrane protein (TIGR02206 family)
LLEFFGKDWNGPAFELFGPPHLVGLTIIVLINLFLIFGWKNPSPHAKRTFRYTLATVLVFNECLWHLWNWNNGWWSIQYMLPLHVCSIFVWLCAYALVFEDYRLYDFIFFMGIGAGTQALITPDAGIYGFPHFRFFQVLVSHGAIVTSAVYMTVIEKLRPYPSSMLRVALGMNLYLGFIMIVNALLGSNYLFVAHKPETPTIIDAMPPWPWYILCLEAIGAAVILILYVPFAIKDRRVRQNPKGL